MNKNTDFEKFCKYMSYVEKKKYEVMKESVDWDTVYEAADSYDDIIFNF